jgi:hypothetical protein
MRYDENGPMAESMNPHEYHRQLLEIIKNLEEEACSIDFESWSFSESKYCLDEIISELEDLHNSI